MAKYSFVTKERRREIQARRRVAHGDPLSGKLKRRVPPTSISGKRKRKLFKKWRREQKENIEKGLVTMQDVEMAVADGSSQSQDTNEKFHKKFYLKKRLRIRLRKSDGKGKNKGKSSDRATAEGHIDAMVE